jgi:hypothetical protein
MRIRADLFTTTLIHRSKVFLNGEDKHRFLKVNRNVRPWDYWVKHGGTRRYLKLQPDGSYRERKPGWDRFHDEG